MIGIKDEVSHLEAEIEKHNRDEDREKLLKIKKQYLVEGNAFQNFAEYTDKQGITQEDLQDFLRKMEERVIQTCLTDTKQ